VDKGKYPTDKNVNSVVLHLPVHFYFFAGAEKRTEEEGKI